MQCIRSFVLPFAVLSATFATAQNGCVLGTVLDDSNSPIEKMYVMIAAVAKQVHQVTDTGEGGQFQFFDLPPGKYRIQTHNQDLGYTFSNMADFTGTFDDPEVEVSMQTECTQITIKREPRAGRLRLKLIDASTGKDIEQPLAAFRRVDGSHVWNQISVYQNDLLIPPGMLVEVQFGAIGYQKTEIIKQAPLQPSEVRVLAVNLQPVGVGCFGGTVLAIDGSPVPGIKVQPLLEDDPLDAKFPLFTTTDKSGKFEIGNLHPGTYQVFVDGQDKGYTGFSTMKAYGVFPQVHVLASKTCAEMNIGLSPPGGHLHVDVIDASTNLPVKDFKYTVKSTISKQSWSSESITEDLVLPPDKPCTLEVHADGYQPSAEQSLGSIQPGEVRRVKVALQPLAVQK